MIRIFSVSFQNVHSLFARVKNLLVHHFKLLTILAKIFTSSYNGDWLIKKLHTQDNNKNLKEITLLIIT